MSGVFVVTAGRGTDSVWKLGVRSPARLQIHVLDHFWMRFQLFQVGEDDLINEDTETDIVVREGKVAFPFALIPG